MNLGGMDIIQSATINLTITQKSRKETTMKAESQEEAWQSCGVRDTLSPEATCQQQDWLRATGGRTGWPGPTTCLKLLDDVKERAWNQATGNPVLLNQQLTLLLDWKLPFSGPQHPGIPNGSLPPKRHLLVTSKSSGDINPSLQGCRTLHSVQKPLTVPAPGRNLQLMVLPPLKLEMKSQASGLL